jgi:hypothetical protein
MHIGCIELAPLGLAGTALAIVLGEQGPQTLGIHGFKGNKDLSLLGCDDAGIA